MMDEDVMDLLEYAFDDDEDEMDYDFDDFDDAEDFDDMDDVLDALMDAADDEDDYSERRRRRRKGRRARRRVRKPTRRVTTANTRGNRGLRAEVRRNAKGIKTVNAKVGGVSRRVKGVVAVNAAQARQIGRLDKRVKLDGALEFAESWNGSQMDLFAVFKGAVKSGLLDNTKGTFASPVAIGGVGLLLNILRNNPQGLGSLFGSQGGSS